MGGKLLNGVRFTTEEGDKLWQKLKPSLKQLFRYVERPDSVLEKSDHGDMDICVGQSFFSDWKKKLAEELDVTFSSNGTVHSFLFEGVQIDLIYCSDDYWAFSWARNYFSWNDFGNLVGRLARHIGFTYGSQGFTYTVYHEEGNYKKEIIISHNLDDVLSFLGFPYKYTSFRTFNSMFEYVTLSALFDPNIYFLENRNHEGRHRDKKRPNYLKFLEYINSEFGAACGLYTKANKQVHFCRACKLWPQLKNEVKEAEEEAKVIEEKRRAFPGDWISNITGLEGPKLGEFIKDHKHIFDISWAKSQENRMELLWNLYDNWEKK